MIHQKAFDELDVDEVLKHYGYKPGEVHRNGVGCGVWRREEAFQKLGSAPISAALCCAASFAPALSWPLKWYASE